VRSWACYGGSLQEAIQKLKYKKDIGLANIFAQPLVGLLKALDWQIDLITAVPLDKQRLSTRGYNQAELLSKPISRVSGIPYVSDAIIKCFPTKSQVGLSESERMLNVLNAFKSNSDIVMGKTVLVVDDVVTTGATIDACSAALKDAGASKVYGISLARSLRL
jgi:ComF family protein